MHTHVHRDCVDSEREREGEKPFQERIATCYVHVVVVIVLSQTTTLFFLHTPPIIRVLFFLYAAVFPPRRGRNDRDVLL